MERASGKNSDDSRISRRRGIQIQKTSVILKVHLNQNVELNDTKSRRWSALRLKFHLAESGTLTASADTEFRIFTLLLTFWKLKFRRLRLNPGNY